MDDIEKYIVSVEHLTFYLNKNQEINLIIRKFEDDIYLKLVELIKGENINERKTLKSEKSLVKRRMLNEEGGDGYLSMINGLLEDINKAKKRTGNIKLGLVCDLKEYWK